MLRIHFRIVLYTVGYFIHGTLQSKLSTGINRTKRLNALYCARISCNVNRMLKLTVNVCILTNKMKQNHLNKKNVMPYNMVLNTMNILWVYFVLTFICLRPTAKRE